MERLFFWFASAQSSDPTKRARSNLQEKVFA
jgi:hypothetical protein